MCWRPIGGKVWRTQGPSVPLAAALEPRVASTTPTIAATTMIATPRTTNQRFRRRGAPDSTRRCGPAALCCGPWLVRGGGGTRLFFFLATTHQKVSSGRARLCAEEVGDSRNLGDDRSRRQRFDEAPAVRPRAQTWIEDRDNPFVCVPSDEAAEPLAQLQDRGGQRVFREPISSLTRDALAACLDERIARRREGQLVDHEQRERLALNVHALPERRGREKNRVDVVPEALEQPLARRVALPQHGELQPTGATRDELVESAVGRSEDERSPGGEPAERDDLVGEAVVVAGRAGLGDPRRNVDKGLVAVVERRRKDELTRIVEAEATAHEPRIEGRRDENRRRLALPQARAEEARDVHGRPRHDSR